MIVSLSYIVGGASMIQNIGNFKDHTDGTIKSVYNIGNFKIIEISVLYNKPDMDVVCVPTHHFCNLGCKMCHLTNKGLNKAMAPINTDDFIFCLVETLKKFKTGKKKILISYMGVGEPLLNLELIEGVFKHESVIKTLGYSDISYALATMMPNNNIFKLKDVVNELNIPLKVHFSMHTPLDDDRKELIPSTKVTVNEALKMLALYSEAVKSNKTIYDNYIKFHRTDEPIEIHYTLIRNINDHNQELDELIKILKVYKIALKFIRFNPISNLKISLNEARWLNKISEEIPDLRIKVYCPPGREVGSSCGEFTKHYYHYEIETKKELEKFNTWKKEHEIV